MPDSMPGVGRLVLAVLAVGVLASGCGDSAREKRIESQLDRCDRIADETDRVRCYEVLDD